MSPETLRPIRGYPRASCSPTATANRQRDIDLPSRNKEKQPHCYGEGLKSQPGKRTEARSVSRSPRRARGTGRGVSYRVAPSCL